MNYDAILLRRYVEDGSEDAFSQLVRNHVDVVYGAALRRTGGDPHRAADVAQEVFTALARQARSLVRHPVLSGWLHATTRNVAINLMISDRRRQQRQHAAIALETAQAAAPAPEWDRLRPVLDAAIDELPENDRLPVVLRFLERRAYAQIGAALGISEDAARLRTDRALEKLRALLARRGITSTAAALGAVVTTHAAVTAPAGLASVLAAESFAAAAGGAGVFAALTTFMTTKTITTAVVSALAAFMLGTYMPRSGAATTPVTSPPQIVSQSSPANDAALRAENERLRSELERLTTNAGQLQSENAKLAAERAALTSAPRRPGAALGMPRFEIESRILNNLRQIAAARDQFILENKRPPSSIRELVGSTAYIRRMIPVDGEDYSSLSMDPNVGLAVTSVSGVKMTYDMKDVPNAKIEVPAEVARAEELRRKVEAPLQAAREAYRMANQGKDPRNDKALIPFFATPQAGADFVEFLEASEKARRY
ncbi:MAG: sigma-70 family RNA polymerase sigma factor [Opitutaceae bacterium]|nr:sigma-70 family RNA polymerase sigma factor [Opitutaceae bacterium]